MKELSDDLKYRLAALTDNPEEVRFASGWNSTTQEEVVLLKLVEGPPILKEHASELSNLEGISKKSVIKEIEAYWNQEDGYFDENWWQDETKKRESLNILLLESLLTEDENGNVGGYDLIANGGYSTFFPKNMEPQEVIDAINEAYDSRVFIEGTRNTYTGYTKSGLEIEMYIDANVRIISAFPKE